MPSIEELEAKYGGGQKTPAAPTAQPGQYSPTPAAEPQSEHSNQLWPWLLGGAAALGGLALTKKPEVAAKLNEIWMGRNSFWGQVPKAVPKGLGLPADLPTIVRRPGTALLSELERLKTDPLEEVTKNIANNPNIQALTKYDNPMDWMRWEDQAQKIYGAGGRTPAAQAAALKVFPPEVAALIQERSSKLPLAQWAKAKLGMEAIPEAEFPYIPRVIDETLNDVTNIGRKGGGLFGDLKTSLEGFQRARSYRSMLEGHLAGVEYHDPRFATILREWRDIQLINTAKFVDNLETKGVLFRDAAAASKASPTGKAFAVEGIPGDKRWFTPSREEAELLKQNLEGSGDSAFRRLDSVINSYFRQPNLMNPFPHFIKNMLYKYGLSGGSPRVFSDMGEYWQGRNPALISQFKQLLPFAEVPSTASEVVSRMLAKYQPPGGTIEEALKNITRFIGQKTNSWSSKMIFQTFDPALRYARWKQYVEGGMPPQEAANHVILDLVRYGTRSDMVDFWKSIPFNMFVPWRIGTMTTLWKQITDHPLRTATFIGAIDYLREMRYRQSGRWTHLPIDYVETPIARIVDEARRGIDQNDPKKAALRSTLAALSTGLTTAAFGPGGAFAVSNLIDVLKTAQGTPDWQRLGNMFFVTAMAGGLYDEVPRLGRAFANGDPAAAARAAADMLGTLAVAEHKALSYRPRRLMEAIPEWVPGMSKAPKVQEAERMQDYLRKAAEGAQVRRDFRKQIDIEERLKRRGFGD